jgi:hypothetical protein
MPRTREPLQVAADILDVEISETRSRIRYAYYRQMKRHHPDKNRGDPRSDRLAALINEAKDLLLGRTRTATLIRDASLVSEVMNHPVRDEDILSYEEWIRSRFYDMEHSSIWPC